MLPPCSGNLRNSSTLGSQKTQLNILNLYACKTKKKLATQWFKAPTIARSREGLAIQRFTPARGEALSTTRIHDHQVTLEQKTQLDIWSLNLYAIPRFTQCMMLPLMQGLQKNWIKAALSLQEEKADKHFLQLPRFKYWDCSSLKFQL